MSQAPRYFIKTWGCQMNVQDEQKMASILETRGYVAAERAADADVVLLNTCSVREKSAEKLFDFLGRIKKLKKDSPDALIGVTGCVAQQEGESVFKRAPHVDLVLGPRRIGRLGEMLQVARGGPAVDTALDDLSAIFWDGGEATRPGGKAFITIMEGCNMGCSFCIVPRTRGREVHRPLDDIVQEVRRRADEGIREVELLGQTVNAYRDGRRMFHHLLAAVAEVDGIRRVRFTSSHPAYLTRNTAAVMADHESICPHLHLPVQSGSDRMLAAMKRGHTAAEYRRRLDDLRQRIPGMAISTDIIVGYPGETDEDMQATLDLLRDVRFSQVFAFAYSPRPGTPAEELTDDVPKEEKRGRLHALFELQDGISRAQNEALLGATRDVLFDGPSRMDPAVASGRTPCNRVINVPGPDPAKVTGEILPVEITAAATHSLAGIACKSPSA